MSYLIFSPDKPTTREMYHEMLNVLPPAAHRGGAFLLGEAWSHDAAGDAVFGCFRQQGSDFSACYLTIRQFAAIFR